MPNNLMNDCVYNSPRFQYLSADQCRKIHWAALEILERTGVRLYLDEAVTMLKKAGADVSDGNLARIPSGMVEKALNTVPKRVVLSNRDSERVMAVEGRRVFFGPGSDCLNILDHRTGKRRKPVLKDVIEGVTLCDALPNIDFVMSMVLPADVNTAVADRYQMEVLLNYTRKPLIFVTYDYEGCIDAVEMAEAVAGGADELRRSPNVACYINVTTGLRHNTEALQKLLFMSSKGLPFIYAPDIISGITGPMTVPGSVAHIIAGVFTGLVLSQLNREGAPFIMPGWAGVPIDMRTMVLPYSHPTDKSIIQAMGHYYQLPTFAIAGSSDSKAVDQQAAAEAALTLMTDTMAGGNIIHDVGYLESGLMYSLPQLAICDEIIGWIKSYIKPVRINDETLAVDLIDRMGHDGQFLQLEHTQKHFREQWYPGMFNREIFDSWAAAGSKSLGERAVEKVESVLQEHQPPLLLEKARKVLKGILEDAVGSAE